MSYNKIFLPNKRIFPFFEKLEENKNINIRIGEKGVEMSYNVRGLNLKEASAFLEMVEGKGINALIEFYLEMKIIKYGPKILRLDTEIGKRNLEAAEQIDLNILVTDYFQPYETMILELPPSYYKTRIAECPQSGSTHTPSMVVINYNTSLRYIIAGVYFDDAQVVTYLIYDPDNEQQETIESQLIHARDGTKVHDFSLATSKEERVYSYYAMKSAMNILINDQGLIKVGKENQKYVERLKKSKKNSAEYVEREIRTMPDLYEFDQNVRFFTEERSGNGSGEGSGGGWTNRPHWRKGHRRRQHYGPGNKEIKVVTIKPVLVNADRFRGNMGDTRVNLF